MIMPTIPHSWGIVAGLALTLLVSSCGWNNTKKALNKERAAHEQTVQTFTDAQVEANRKAEEKRKALEKKGKEDAKQAAETYASLYDRYESNLLRFQANQSRSRRPSGDQSKDSKGSTGPSGSSGVLEGQTDELWITMSDGRICAVNTARLQAVVEWANKQPR